MARRFLVTLVLTPLSLACATAGAGANPPLPGEPSGGSDGGAPQGADAAQATPADDAGIVADDAGAPSDSDGAANAANAAGTCNDILHGLVALGGSLLGQKPATCASSSDCSAGECCYVSPTGSACVKQ
jgi:hypothetical protein